MILSPLAKCCILKDGCAGLADCSYSQYNNSERATEDQVDKQSTVSQFSDKRENTAEVSESSTVDDRPIILEDFYEHQDISPETVGMEMPDKWQASKAESTRADTVLETTFRSNTPASLDDTRTLEASDMFDPDLSTTCVVTSESGSGK